VHAAEFCQDRLRFAGLIPERLIFRPKKSIQYRLSACNVGLVNAMPNMQKTLLQFRQAAQLSQRDRATLRVIEYFAKSLKVTRNDTFE